MNYSKLGCWFQGINDCVMWKVMFGTLSVYLLHLFNDTLIQLFLNYGVIRFNQLITVKGQRLQVVDKFTYLGSTLSRVVHIDDEVNARIAKASAAFGQLHGSIWDRSGIRLDTKLKVYRLVVLPTLLYACETWTVYQRHAKRLNHFHTSCLRKLLKIKWQDRIPDTEVLKRAGMQSIHTLLKLAQLRWTGHVTRISDERLPKKILYGELQVGKRSHGGQKKRYKDTLKASLKDFNIPTVMGTDCTRSYKVARPHKKGSW